jgi:hypothetical protein
MADTKITALAAITTVDPAADVLPIVDISDTSMAASGTTKKVTSNQILGAGGTATLASATITGDLTVATDRLKVVTGSTAVQTGATTQLQVGTTSWPSTVIGKSGSRSLFGNTGEVVLWTEAAPAIGNYSTLFVTAKTGAGATTMGGLQIRAGIENASNSDGFVSLWTSNSAAGGFVERYKIDSTGVATWSNVGGVAGTAMTLNANGLGIGVTPSAWGGSYKALQLLSVARSIAATGAGVGDLTVAFNAIYDSTDSRWEYAGTGDKAGRYSQTGSGNHRWFVSNTVGTAGNEITDFASAAMTLDASGNLLVGKTSSSLGVVGVEARPNGEVWSTNAASTDGAGSSYILYSTGATAYRFYVGMGGTVFATNTTISAISDARLKENVQDIDVGLGAILALKPRKFDWKAGKGKDIKGDRGFIAQEFETVFPNLIDEWKDEAPEGEAPYKSVRQDLIPVLVKAIQELTARVQTLEAK